MESTHLSPGKLIYMDDLDYPPPLMVGLTYQKTNKM